jgi:hypothetical protein
MSLFAFWPPSGSWSHLTRNDFLFLLSNIWASSGLDVVSGHSFRIGGTVSLLLAGVPPEVVAATGGWTSMTFLTYWRQVEDIIALGTSRAYADSDLSRLSGIVDTFRRV